MRSQGKIPRFRFARRGFKVALQLQNLSLTAGLCDWIACQFMPVRLTALRLSGETGEACNKDDHPGVLDVALFGRGSSQLKLLQSPFVSNHEAAVPS
jgi:hypothetical protein